VTAPGFTVSKLQTRPAPAVELRVQRVLLLVRRVVVASGGVGLPQFHQHVRARRAGAVQDAALDPDALARRPWPGQHAAQVLAEDVQARLRGDQADVDVGTGGLARRLAQARGPGRLDEGDHAR